MMRIIVCGSRKLRNPERLLGELGSCIHQAWANALNDPTWSEFRSTVTIVHGACPTGADLFAEQFANDYKIRLERYPADWSQGPSAFCFWRRTGPWPDGLPCGDSHRRPRPVAVPEAES